VHQYLNQNQFRQELPIGSNIAIWKISLRFFSPPEKPSFMSGTKTFYRFLVILIFHGSLLAFRSLACPLHRFTSFVNCWSDKIGYWNSRNFYWVLKRKNTPCALFLQELIHEDLLLLDFTVSYFIGFISCDDWRKRTFSAPFGPIIAWISPALLRDWFLIFLYLQLRRVDFYA
jgi:hypothetical protein